MWRQCFGKSVDPRLEDQYRDRDSDHLSDRKSFIDFDWRKWEEECKVPKINLKKNETKPVRDDEIICGFKPFKEIY
jgi:hypothetical protein